MDSHDATGTIRLRTVNDLAEYLRISRAQIYNLVRAGHLRPVRVGTRLRFEDAEVERFLREGTAE